MIAILRRIDSNITGRIAFGLVVVAVAAALLAPLIAPYGPSALGP